MIERQPWFLRIGMGYVPASIQGWLLTIVGIGLMLATILGLADLLSAVGYRVPAGLPTVLGLIELAILLWIAHSRSRKWP
jgi:hypothetical protein